MKRHPRCRRCKRGPQVVGKLCGFCYAGDVEKFEKKSEKTDLVVK